MSRNPKRSRGRRFLVILVLLTIGGVSSLSRNNNRPMRASYSASFTNPVGSYISATVTPKQSTTPRNTATPKNTVSPKNTQSPKPIATKISSSIKNNTFTFSASSRPSTVSTPDKSLSYSGTFNNNQQPQNGTVSYESNGATVERKITNGKLSNTITITAGATIITSVLSAKDSVDFIEEVTITYANGDIYTGSLVNGKKAGQGTYHWKNGAWYSGTWANDTMDGKGTYYFTSSTKKHYLSGNFSNGSPSGTLIYASEKGILYNTIWSKGKCLSIGRK